MLILICLSTELLPLSGLLKEKVIMKQSFMYTFYTHCPLINGLFLRSFPTLVGSPWPERMVTSSGRVRIFSRMLCRSFSLLPVGRSLRPQLENQIAGKNHLVVGAVQTEAAFAVAGRVQHVQMLVAECQGFALLDVAVGGGHILQFEAEDRRVGVCAVVFLHSRLVQQDVNTVFFHAPRISRYVVEMRMCIDDILDIQMVVGHIFTDLSVFVKPAVARIDNHRLSCLVRQDISVHHQRVEVKRLDFHIHKF